ncbi:hypothetical protein D3870_04585 [Noviherbaspirillum cavernae]|uniref:Glycosyltransferase family 25 protein n=2 Tax=Noviherbaspirillum cavernae TaxID=2320862 RepID=A0A418WYR1_9BURK|nr:hypothetical protein D3870_04585 [Noviherbaspirillum cavernae]
MLIEAYFARGGVANSRVEAITPESLPRISVRKPFANSIPELAILTSHLDAIGMACQSGHETAVIMEDDVRSRYVFDALTLISSAPHDWEILQLHVSNRPVVLELGEMYLRHGVLWHEWEPTCYSAGAYVINRKGAARILSHYRPNGTDIDLTGVHAFGKLVADHLLYRRSCCYTATIPYFMNDIALTSTHAPHRDETHHRPGALGVESIMQQIESQAVAGSGHARPLLQAGYPFALRAL